MREPAEDNDCGMGMMVACGCMCAPFTVHFSIAAGLRCLPKLQGKALPAQALPSLDPGTC